MYCPTCGKETPENSKFCLHCGSPIFTSSKPILEKRAEPTEWEYKEYVHRWAHEQIYYNLNSYQDAHVRIDVWMNYQSRILEELQKWYDEGWQPIGEVGPSSIQLNYFSKWNWWGAFLVTIATAGIGIFLAPFIRTSLAEPAEFRLKMRRVASLGQANRKDSQSSYQQSNLTQEGGFYEKIRLANEEKREQVTSIKQSQGIKVYKRRSSGDDLTPITKTTNYHGRLALVVGEPIGALGELQCPWCDQEYEISKIDRNVFFKCEKCQNVVLVTHD